MRFAESARMLAGGTIIYVAMATCAKGDSMSPGQGEGGGGIMAGGNVAMGGAGAGGRVDAAAGSGSWLDAAVEAITNPVADAAAQTAGGSRLRAKYIIGSDGSRQFSTWYDRTRNEDCAYARASDGSLRCLPSLANVVGVSTYYGDSTCTQVMAAVSPAPCPRPPVKWAVRVTGTQTCTRYALYPIGETFMPPAVYLRRSDTGQCVVQPVVLPPGGSWHRLGPEEPPTSFVEGTEQLE